MKHRLFLAPLVLLAAGCAASSIQNVPVPDLSVDLENPAKARVYLVRRDDAIGKRYPVHIYVQEKHIGTLGPGDYLVWEEPPRFEGVVRIVTEIPDLTRNDAERMLPHTVEAGNVYWVAIGLESGTFRAVGERLGEAEGRALVEASSRAPAH